MKKIVNYNIKNFNKINLIEKGKHLIKGNNRWLICSSGIKELPIGSVISAPINIENQRELPVKITKNNVIRLSDIAEVKFGAVSEKTLFKAQQKNKLDLKTVGIGIYARSGAS